MSDSSTMPTHLMFRSVNEQILRLLPDVGLGPLVDLLCECGDVRCAERVSVPRAECERAFAASDRLLLAPGHSPA